MLLPKKRLGVGQSEAHYPSCAPAWRGRRKRRQKLRTSLLLESLTVEFQGPAVLSYRAHELVIRAVRKVSFDFDRDRDFCAHLTNQMSDDLVGNSTGVAANPSRIDAHGAVEPAQHLRYRRSARRL